MALRAPDTLLVRTLEAMGVHLDAAEVAVAPGDEDSIHVGRIERDVNEYFVRPVVTDSLRGQVLKVADDIDLFLRSDGFQALPVLDRVAIADHCDDPLAPMLVAAAQLAGASGDPAEAPAPFESALARLRAEYVELTGMATPADRRASLAHGDLPSVAAMRAVLPSADEATLALLALYCRPDDVRMTLTLFPGIRAPEVIAILGSHRQGAQAVYVYFQQHALPTFPKAIAAASTVTTYYDGSGYSPASYTNVAFARPDRQALEQAEAVLAGYEQLWSTTAALLGVPGRPARLTVGEDRLGPRVLTLLGRKAERASRAAQFGIASPSRR